MKTEFWETCSGSCLLRMGTASSSKPGGQLKSVPDGSQPPRPHQGAARNQGRVPLAQLQGRAPSTHPPAPQPQPSASVSLIWGFPSPAEFSVLCTDSQVACLLVLQMRSVCPCDLGLSECPGGALAVQPSVCWKHAPSGWAAPS